VSLGRITEVEAVIAHTHTHASTPTHSSVRPTITQIVILSPSKSKQKVDSGIPATGASTNAESQQ